MYYIKNHPHLELYVADRIVNEDSYNFTFYGFFLPQTGWLYLRADAINPNYETFLHELLHTAIQYNGVHNIINNVNNVLRDLRRELEHDEGLAGQIYRASQVGKTLTLNDKNSRSDVINAIESAMGNFRNPRTVFSDVGSDTGEGKAIQNFREAKLRVDNIQIGEHEQRERSRRFISRISWISSIIQHKKLTADKLPTLMDMVIMKSNNLFHILTG